MYIKNRMICTVGRSLLSNFERKYSDSKEPIPSKDILQELLSLDPSDKMCGAEINSVNSIVNQGLLNERLKLIFLVSDTDDGVKTGEILKSYFQDAKCPINFSNVSYEVIKGLNGEDRNSFRQKGLKEIAKVLADLTSQDPYSTIINATGGYKAQISFAVLIGQILKVKVYYMYEAFNEIIELPPLPVSFDYTLWMKNYELLEILERGTFDADVLKGMDKPLKVLYETERGDHEKLYILNPIGIIFHRGFKEVFKRDKDFLPQPRTKEPKYIANDKEGHSKIFDNKHQISKKLLDIPYITKLRCDYYNPKSGNQTSAKFINEKELKIRFTKNGETIEFIAETTAKTEHEKDAVKVFILEKMKEW